MKKFVAVLLTLCMLCLWIPAMAEDSVAGVWKLNRAVTGDQELNADMLAADQIEIFRQSRNPVYTVLSAKTAGSIQLPQFPQRFIFYEAGAVCSPV